MFEDWSKQTTDEKLEALKEALESTTFSTNDNGDDIEKLKKEIDDLKDKLNKLMV